VTLSTLQLERKRKSLKRMAAIYAVIAGALGGISAIYLHFSYGVSSPFMVFLFAPALVLGALPALLMSFSNGRMPSATTRRLWNSAVATLSVGFLVRAIINISGRYTSYDTIYWIFAGILLLGAILWQAKINTAVRKRMQTAV